MLTSLSQFQAQGWEKCLSRITFIRGTNSRKSPLIGRNSVLPLRYGIAQYVYKKKNFHG